MPIWARRKSKPNPGVGIDRRHPLAQALVGCWAFNEGSGVPINAVDGQQAASNTLAWTPGPYGPTQPGWTLKNASGTAIYASVAVPNGSALDVTGSTISYGGWVYPTVSGVFQCLVAKSNGSANANRQYALYLDSSATNRFYVVVGGGVVFGGSMLLSNNWTVNAWNHIIITYDGALLNAYLNSALVYSVAQSGTIANVSGANISMGYDVGAANYGLNGYLDGPIVCNRVLSGADVRSLYADPWQLFQSPRIQWLYKAGSTIGGSATLSAATGVFSFSGNAANLLAGRVLGAATGSYGLTGQAAALLSGRVLPAGTGVFTLTGNDANLLAGRVIAASTGVYVLTGQAANLVYTQPGAYVLVAGTGTFSLAGQAANLLVSRVLAASTGVYAVTGQAASLTWSGGVLPVVTPDPYRAYTYPTGQPDPDKADSWSFGGAES